MADVKFYSGSKSAYSALQSKDANGIYFLNNGEIFKGSQKMASGVLFVDSLPATTDAVQDVLYVLPTGAASVYNGTAFTQVLYPVVDEIAEETSGTSIPNVTAVKAAIAAAVPEATSVDEVTITKTSDGKLTIKGFDAATDGQLMKVTVGEGGVRTLTFYTPTVSDEQMGQMQAAVTGIEEEIVTILGDVSDIKNDVLDLESGLGTANNEITAVKEDITTIEGNIGTIQTNVSAAQDNIAALQTGKADKGDSLADYGITDAYTKTEIDNMVQDAMHYEGSVADMEALEAIENPSKGDIYQVTSEDKMYIYNGTSWDEFSSGVDLSGYVTKEELNSTLPAYKDVYVTNGLTALQEGASETQILAAIGSIDELLTAAEAGKVVIDVNAATHNIKTSLSVSYVVNSSDANKYQLSVIFAESTNKHVIYQIQKVSASAPLILNVVTKTLAFVENIPDVSGINSVINSLPDQFMTDIVNVQRTATTNTAEIRIFTKQDDGTYSPDVQHGVLTLIPAGQGVDGVNGAGLMTAADKTKLDSLENYTLPAATTDTLGGVKVDGSTITAVDGTIGVAKVANALTVGSKTFDGSAAVTITAADIGAYTTAETDAKISSAMSWNEL